MEYLEDAIDTKSEYAKKYLDLMSRPDSGNSTEIHHIVPVAFFADVLGLKNCRTPGSQDMKPENLVSLSRGHHVLAHFYLAKCARRCINVQMKNAFCLSFDTTDLSTVTEEDVLDKVDEITAAYVKMKSMGKVHKDGIEVRRTRTCITACNWFNGKRVGPIAKWTPDGTIREISCPDDYIIITKDTHTWHGNNNGFTVKIEHACGPHNIEIDLYDGDRNNTVCLECYCGGRSFELSNRWGFTSNPEYDRSRIYDNGVIMDSLSKLMNSSMETAKGMARAVNSIRQYARMLNFNPSRTLSDMIDMVVAAAPKAEPFPVYEIPDLNIAR